MADRELPTFDESPGDRAGLERTQQIKEAATETIELGDLLATVEARPLPAVLT